MTKQEANEIKKALPHYTTYYVSKKETLRVRVYSYINNSYNPKEEADSIVEALNLLTKKGLRPEYTIERKTYQGFIHDTDILFK